MSTRNRITQAINDAGNRQDQADSDTRKNDAQAYCPDCKVWYDSAKDSSHAGH